MLFFCMGEHVVGQRLVTIAELGKLKKKCSLLAFPIMSV